MTSHVILISKSKSLADELSKALPVGYNLIVSTSQLLEGLKLATEKKAMTIVVDQDFSKNLVQDFQHFFDEHSSASQVPWVLLTTEGATDLAQAAAEVGVIDFLSRPISVQQVSEIWSRLDRRKKDPLNEIMDMVQGISGVQLGPEKRLLVETRLMRRARMIGVRDISAYLDFFRANRQSEVKEIISVMTTHTTEFFREADHFDFLFDHVYPDLVKRQNHIVFWSAASSTGEELYSMAISFFEFCRSKNIDASRFKLEFVGTDIDANSVKSSQNGVYDHSLLKRISPEIASRYFDIGSGELAGLVRVKDYIHKLCTFKTGNLLAANYPAPKADVIFLRNVLIYFNKEQVQKIANKMNDMLKEKGFLFVGHSESLAQLSTPFASVGNSVYQVKGQELQTVSANQSKAPTPSGRTKPIKVFVVDDSATIRAMLNRVFVKDHGFEVIGEAVDPIEAKEKLLNLHPDVITLDIHMPRMDGVTYLEELNKNKNHPPVVMISSVSYDDAANALRCFELGATDYIEKPQGLNLVEEAEKIRAVVGAAATSKKVSFEMLRTDGPNRVVYNSAPAGVRDLIAIGASTGGIEAIKAVIAQFPEKSPPCVIVQHIPPNFSATFAKRMDELCDIHVKEAAHGDILKDGHVYIAPGGKQMRIVASGKELVVQITDDPPVNRHRPSVDYMFESLLKLDDHVRICATILTGMGSDGARGLKALRDQGAHTIAQDEQSCVVFGMPKAAIALGGAVETLPLQSISYHILRAFSKQLAAA